MYKVTVECARNAEYGACILNCGPGAYLVDVLKVAAVNLKKDGKRQNLINRIEYRIKHGGFLNTIKICNFNKSTLDVDGLLIHMEKL